MIVVVGGTGRLGGLVGRELQEMGLPVRMVSRHPQHGGVAADVRHPASVAAAIGGASVVVSAVHGFADPGQSPDAVDRAGNLHLIDAAKAEGAEVVLMSVVGASATSPMELFRAKAAAERYLWASGVTATVVRAAAFMELWIDILCKTAGRSGRPVVFGRGMNPINFVSVRDVTALVTRVVTDPSARGRTLEIGGPANLTFTEFACAIQAAYGGTRQPRHVPRAVLRLGATVSSMRPAIARQVLAALAMDTVDLTLAQSSARGHYGDLPCTTLNDCLRARHNRNPTSLTGVPSRVVPPVPTRASGSLPRDDGDRLSATDDYFADLFTAMEAV